MDTVNADGSVKINKCGAGIIGQVVENQSLYVKIKQDYDLSFDFCPTGERRLLYVVKHNSVEVDISGCEGCVFNRERSK